MNLAVSTNYENVLLDFSQFHVDENRFLEHFLAYVKSYHFDVITEVSYLAHGPLCICCYNLSFLGQTDKGYLSALCLFINL